MSHFICALGYVALRSGVKCELNFLVSSSLFGCKGVHPTLIQFNDRICPLDVAFEYEFINFSVNIFLDFSMWQAKDLP